MMSLRRMAANAAAGLDGCDPSSSAFCVRLRGAWGRRVGISVSIHFDWLPFCFPSALVDATSFADRLSVMAALEDADDWQDGWSPREIQDSDIYTASNGASSPCVFSERFRRAFRKCGAEAWPCGESGGLIGGAACRGHV